MRPRARIAGTWLAPFALLTMSAEAAANSLQGEPEAVARVSAMIEQMGGASTWSKVRTLYIVYDQWRSDPEPAKGRERAWRDIGLPNERLEWSWQTAGGNSSRIARSFTPSMGWRATDANVEPLPVERHTAYISLWERDFYTMIRRFAEGDLRLRLRMSEQGEVVVSNESGDAIGQWRIDSAGNLRGWRAPDSRGGQLSWLYGPYKCFGKIRFPAWGADANGDYRIEYAEIHSSADPIPAEVFMKPEAAPRPGLGLQVEIGALQSCELSR